jgi:glycosyltransferase involved in cell wall biosynthesis
MRVLVYEQEFGGHYLKYVADILPSLLELVDDVVVAITPRGAASSEFREFLAPFVGQVDFQSSLPEGNPELSLRGRLRLLENLQAAVRTFRPDYVLVPSGDGVSSAAGMLRPFGRGGLPGRVPSEVGIHYGYGLKGIGAKNYLKDLFYLQTQRLSPWVKIHYVSVTNFEWVCSHGGALANRARLLPHPVRGSPRYSKQECRRRLGVPEDGRYIGLAAVLDTRKAIPELLAAFKRATGEGDRLLMAGRLAPPFTQLIAAEYGDLVRQCRIIVRDGYYDDVTQDLILGALDVACSPYRRFGQLSAAMLNGVAAGRPVLVNEFGWMEAMVRRFGFGWTCAIHDPAAFASAIRHALDQAPDYCESEATRRLLEFHAPENFGRAWVQGIRETLGRPPQSDLAPWSAVVEALTREAAAKGVDRSP